ncbi:MAG: hypothetical protein ACYS47_04280 [Planctomycetota bacterium]
MKTCFANPESTFAWFADAWATADPPKPSLGSTGGGGSRIAHRVAGLILGALLLASCAASPLRPYDRIAFTAPKSPPGSDLVPHRAGERLVASLARAVSEGSRFEVAGAAATRPPACVYVHPRIRRFDAPEGSRTGSAIVDYLFTDARGGPVVATEILTLASAEASASGNEVLARASARDFLRFLHRFGGFPLDRPAGSGKDPDEPPPILTAPPPKSMGPPKSRPGRLSFRTRFSLTDLGESSAGRGRGAPDYDDIFEAGAGGFFEVVYGFAPGLEFSLGGGMQRFAGRTFDREGLTVRFEALDLRPLFAGARLLLPLSRTPSKRWWSSWSPFEDTGGFHLCLSLHAGAAVHSNVTARVVRDESAEIPHLLPGERIPYYRTGAIFWMEALVGGSARLGAGEGWFLSGSILAGFLYAMPPAHRGVGSESAPIHGVPLALELALHF